MASKETAAPQTRIVAQYKGFHGTVRTLTKADQNALAGVNSGVGKEDLVWPINNGKLDVTDVHPSVLEYLRSDPKFSVSEVEVTPES